MLESRSAYGYYGSAGGVTGENTPDGINDVVRRIPYYKFKKDYPTCKHWDYDKATKTIMVAIPEERQTGANFGNKYQLDIFHFWVLNEDENYCYAVEQKAKTESNAMKHVKSWCRWTHKEMCGYHRKYLGVANWSDYSKSRRLTIEEWEAEYNA